MSFGQHIRVFICVVIMGVIVGFVMNGQDAKTDHRYIDVVKAGTLQDYDITTIEQAFNSYFTAATWHYYEARSGEHVVELSGNARYNEIDGEAFLQFVFDEHDDDDDDDGQFNVGALKFNGIVQQPEEKWQWIELIYTNWENQQVALEQE